MSEAYGCVRLTAAIGKDSPVSDTVLLDCPYLLMSSLDHS